MGFSKKKFLPYKSFPHLAKYSPVLPILKERSNQLINSKEEELSEFLEDLKKHSCSKKLMVLISDYIESENVVTAMHPESEDFSEHNGQEVAPIDEIVTSVDGMRIIEIISGKSHNIIRTEEGKIYSYGKGEFGSLGLGGCMFSPVPRLISKLDNKRIIAVSCGAHHSLALSEIGDLFSWGRGFEGQLGLLEKTESSSTPQFIPHFFKYDHTKDVKMLRKKPIHKIACGSYHSLAIDEDGALYSWGEARCGQTGTGRKIKEWKPVKL